MTPGSAPKRYARNRARVGGAGACLRLVVMIPLYNPAERLDGKPDTEAPDPVPFCVEQPEGDAE